jgi:hypothetical protein
MATWLVEAIVEENVAAQARDTSLLVPTGEHFQLTGEIKNAITAVAKTTHYWDDHVGAEAKALYVLEDRWALWKPRLRSWMPFRSSGSKVDICTTAANTLP